MPFDAMFAEHAAWLPLLIFLARIVDVSIGTIRLICVTRGQRALAVGLGFFEVMIWTLAISSVFSHLDNWLNILAYAAGFATGNAVGMAIEQRLAIGTQIVQLISRGAAHAVAERLRFAGLVVTTLLGQGRDGPVAICLAIVPRRRTRELLRMAREIDPDVIVTAEDAATCSLGQASVHHPGKTPFRLFGNLIAAGGWRRAGRHPAVSGEDPWITPAA